ncbi:MAG: carbohydrate binding domain-containing protein [Clostridia bacterium]|nr:carbohydrate binding domain-containing protein [Clostridia bacterium]
MKKTRQLLRLVSFVIACAICIGMVSISAGAVSTSGITTNNATVSVNDLGSAVINGGFETGTLDGWNVEPGYSQSTQYEWYKAASVTDTEKHSGNYAGQMTKSDDSDHYGYQTVVYNPQVGTNYTLTYWAKATGTAKVGSALLAQGDKSDKWTTYAEQWMNGEEHFITATGDWEQRSFTFSVPNNDNIQMITIRIMVYGTGTIWLDDVALNVKTTTGEDVFANGNFDESSTVGWTMGASTEVPPTPEVKDFFINGGFETTFAANSSFGYNINDAVAEFTTENVHSGTYAAKYTSGYFTNYATAVEPGTYTLSMWVNTVSGATVEISGFVTGCGIPWQDFAMTPVRGVTDGWVKISGEVTFTEAGNPQFGFKSYDGTGVVYIDDIQLTQEELKPLTKTTELLANNDFASGTANWNFSGNSAIINEAGTNVLKMTVAAGGSEYIQQTVAVEPGKTYDFAADLMTQEQDGNDAQAQVWAIDSTWNMICPSEYKTYGWKHLTATYTAPAGVTSITILLQHNVVAGVSYWKNISFSLTETITEAKYENVFVNGDFETVIDGTIPFGTNVNSAVAELTTANVHSGSYAMKYTSGYFTNYATAVEAGTYTLSMWVNTVSGDTAEMSGFVSGCGIPWQDFAMTAVRGVTDGWVKISGEVTFTEAGTPQFGFKSYDGAGEVYIDDIRLDKVTYTPVYPSSTYTEGIGTFGGDNAVLMADTTNEWWNYGTAVEEGKKYVYAMDVKIENAEADFQFYPYVMNFGDFWQNGPVFNNNTDWQHIEFEFTAAKPDAANGTRFGFSRTGNGTVYLDNVTLTEVAEEPETGITSENENLAGDRTVAAEKNGNHAETIANVVAGKKYILKFNVISWSEDNNAAISAKLGTAGFENLVIDEQDAFVAVTVELTANESGNVDLTFGAGNTAAIFKNIELYRAYTLGDVNGDDALDVRDLVRYKKYLAEKAELATYIYADMNGDNALDSVDMADVARAILAA